MIEVHMMERVTPMYQLTSSELSELSWGQAAAMSAVGLRALLTIGSVVGAASGVWPVAVLFGVLLTVVEIGEIGERKRLCAMAKKIRDSHHSGDLHIGPGGIEFVPVSAPLAREG